MPPYHSLIVDVHQDQLFRVYERRPGVLSYEACLASKDPDLVAFADAACCLIDMRQATPGSGFAIDGDIQRHETLPIFALPID
jgi:hypothetical protein